MTFLLQIKAAIPLFNTRGKAVTADSASAEYKLFSPLPLSYYEVNEPAAWVNVDRQSGELKVANTIDRESHFVKDGRYTMTVKAVDACEFPANEVSPAIALLSPFVSH